MKQYGIYIHIKLSGKETFKETFSGQENVYFCNVIVQTCIVLYEWSFAGDKWAELFLLSGTVFLDGVPVDFPLIPDGSGWYRCLQCDYQSVNREHFKMHVVIHRPPKWKCFYCDQKYSVM